MNKNDLLKNIEKDIESLEKSLNKEYEIFFMKYRLLKNKTKKESLESSETIICWLLKELTETRELLNKIKEV